MYSFLGITAESIQSRSVRIDSYLPNFVRASHFQFMRNFRIKGDFSQLGHPVNAFLIINSVPHEVSLKVSLFPATVGFKYVAIMRVLERRQRHMLFDKQGKLQEYSPELAYLFEKVQTNPQWSVFSMFPRLKTVVQNSGINNIWKTTIHHHKFRAFAWFHNYTLSQLSIGVCTFLTSTKYLSKREVANSSTRSRKSVSHRPISQKYHRSSSQARSINMRIVLAALLCFGITMIVCCHYLCSSDSQKAEDLSTFYLAISNGVRTRTFDMNTRSTLLRLVYIGAISNNVLADTFPEVPEFDAYLRDTDSQLSVTNPLDRYLLSPKRSILAIYPPVFIKSLPITATKVNYLTFVGLLKSFYYDVFSWSRADYLNNYQAIAAFNDALITELDPALFSTVYTVILQSIISELTNMKSRIYSLSAFFVLVWGCVALIFYSLV